MNVQLVSYSQPTERFADMGVADAQAAHQADAPVAEVVADAPVHRLLRVVWYSFVCLPEYLRIIRDSRQL